MKKMIIVAVEATPSVSKQMNGWVFLGPAYPSGAKEDLSLISSALSLMAGDLEDKGLGRTGTSSNALRGTWSPALTLAKEAATLIAFDSACEVFVREEQYRLPLSPRDNARTVLEAWYRRNDPALSAEEIEKAGASPLLELGLSDFFLVDDQILIQILAKVVDPLSGEVRARAKGHAMVKVDSPEELFLHGGEDVKAVFAAAGRHLLEKTLKDMGILSTKGNPVHPR
jgi:hypothetical protein